LNWRRALACAMLMAGHSINREARHHEHAHPLH
jgi:hypothetical protein